MASFFSSVLNDADKLEKEYLGPDYKYYDAIKSPPQLGMGTKGDDLSKDVAGLIAYVEALITGEGEAVKKPLGNKFFLKTPAQCKDIKTKKNVDRYMYINNAPTGELAIFPDMPDINLGNDFKGLVPGILNDIQDLNPLTLFSSFMEGEYPPCAEVTLPVIDENGVTSKASHFVAISDLKLAESRGQIKKGTVTSEMEKEVENINKTSATQEGFIGFNNARNGLLREASKYRNRKSTFEKVYLALYMAFIAYVAYKGYKILMKK